METRVLENYRAVVEDAPIGVGGEHEVYATKDGNHVIKVTGPIGHWQTQGEDFVLKSEQALERENVNRLPSAILINPTLIRERPGKDGILQPNIAQMFPRLDRYDMLTLRWPQLKDPAIQEKIIDLCKRAERIFEQDKFGIDPLGMGALVDNLEGLVKTILESLCKNENPNSIQALIRESLHGVKGHMRNVLVAEKDEYLEGEKALPYTGSQERVQILKKGEIYLADTGMHDLRKTHPIKFWPTIKEQGLVNVLRKIPAQQLTFPVHYLMWASMIELLIKANPNLAKRPDLPFIYNKGVIEQIKRNSARAVSRVLVDMMVPQFERFEELNPQFARTDSRLTDL